MNEIVVGHVSSSYQLLNFILFLKLKRYKNCNKYVILDSYFKQATFSKSLVDSLDKIDVKILNRGFRDIEALIKGNKNLILISPGINVQYIRYFSKMSFIKIDDGIGSYANFLYRYKAFIRERGISIKVGVFPIWYALMTIIEMIKLKERFASFDNDSYRSCLTGFIEVESGLVEEEYALFCSQPYVDIGVLTESEYKKILYCAEKLAKGKGIPLKILRHPADRGFDYSSYEVINTCSIFEEFVCKNKNQIKLVLGINSTCLITASNIFGIESISIQNTFFSKMTNNFPVKIKELFKKSSKKVDV
ncbi:alpha-2,8-polysialyltransferase family protein [Pseudoalteromonas sp. SR43-2]|uniref:alpha-2,8-polysialyltransferase family protein n=1 Tax=Pseudoalteromonas sp. SR43-2 TaxID=2760944 RepID=UPI0021761CBA|nr:alpha-2,8-polysialyltransferase family protein [Pseudoalteromonas sp. SR43-2]